MKNLKKSFLLLGVVFMGYGCSSENSSTADSDSDSGEMAEGSNEANAGADAQEDASAFMMKAASGGLMEVELGKMAQKNGAHAEVKTFGQRMETDHGKANEELKMLAATKNITIPSTPAEDHQQHITEMQKLTGANFDQHYMEMMVKDHQEDIELFEEAAQNNEMDPDIKAFAQKTLPVLKQHHELAQTTHDKVKK